MRGIGGGMGGITPEQNVVRTMIIDLYDAQNQSGSLPSLQREAFKSCPN